MFQRTARLVVGVSFHEVQIACPEFLAMPHSANDTDARLNYTPSTTHAILKSFNARTCWIISLSSFCVTALSHKATLWISKGMRYLGCKALFGRPMTRAVSRSCGLETATGAARATGVPSTNNCSVPLLFHEKARLNQSLGSAALSSFHCLSLVLSTRMYLSRMCSRASPRDLVVWPPLDTMYELLTLGSLCSFIHDMNVKPPCLHSSGSLKHWPGN